MTVATSWIGSDDTASIWRLKRPFWAASEIAAGDAVTHAPRPGSFSAKSATGCPSGAATNLMRSDFSAVSPVTMHFRNDISSAAMAALKGGAIREEGLMQALLIADDASIREARQLNSAVQPEWTENGLPAELLGQAAGRGSVAYVGIIPVKSAANRRMCDHLRNMITRWRQFSGRDDQQDKMEQE